MNNKKINDKKLIEKIIGDDTRWIEVIDVFRVESANINAGEGGPSEIDIKTIHLEDGTVVPRISPQAIFRMIRDYWIEIGEKVDIARDEPGKPAPLPECNPEKYIDDDLFGYLMARKEETGKRGISESRSGPIRSIGAIGLFEYPDDTDFLTSIFSTTEAEAGGSMVTKRIYTNTFLLPIWCDVRRIGREAIPQKDKTLKFEPLPNVDSNERKRRIIKFFESLFYLGKRMPGASKMPLSPKMVIVGLFKKPNITLYDAIENDLTVRIKEVKLQKEQTRTGEEKIVSIASGKVIFSIEPESFVEKCNLYKEDIIEIKVGVLSSFFDKKINEIQQTIRDKLDVKIKEKVSVIRLENLKSELCFNN
ncbi:type I-B CRISPR-associated protein Cas7/Cst2/DevR [Candidatus Aminicenantes bacterium AC-335-K20]|jgi:CRISPR-associated protein Cst2|nr:type I-B CRISPR-associated protein Cas7/Cst2/DevR [SCandidatus Aminicenantes bacterium Aminicenantia_JdfR_composite]MCP2598606.1 type I-B CRISPR-associated protein Cas7/Cst2/DevR [Candidatus Aminicenantes bacterium AC-335-L06]MCP2619203.1 type I-B CRISPR-associated protein Cas7/Cst2/DevR [Candidatus Aminicenantes bacterium AC-335-K20]MCP2620874.1 type I-B CRISPR-associated protein Cas7/Cst2/DevR [Candidatus Aminicenantes bacterium AC-334-E05]